MIDNRQRHIKQAQKESLLLRELAQFFHQITLDDSMLRGLTINRVKLSPDRSLCTVFFYSPDGRELFDKLLPTLILYKPSLRKAIAGSIRARYAPELQFRFDKTYERQLRLNQLLEQVATDDMHDEEEE